MEKAAVKALILNALERGPNGFEMTYSIPGIRNALNVPKSLFDQAALELYRERRVYLEYHDYPHSLTVEGRAELVYDPAGTLTVGGNWYVGISGRRG